MYNEQDYVKTKIDFKIIHFLSEKEMKNDL